MLFGPLKDVGGFQILSECHPVIFRADFRHSIRKIKDDVPRGKAVTCGVEGPGLGK
jgi:hypothetical protein